MAALPGLFCLGRVVTCFSDWAAYTVQKRAGPRDKEQTHENGNLSGFSSADQLCDRLFPSAGRRLCVRGAAPLAERGPGGSHGSRQHAGSFGTAASGLGTVSVSGRQRAGHYGGGLWMAGGAPASAPGGLVLWNESGPGGAGAGRHSAVQRAECADKQPGGVLERSAAAAAFLCSGSVSAGPPGGNAVWPGRTGTALAAGSQAARRNPAGRGTVGYRLFLV